MSELADRADSVGYEAEQALRQVKGLAVTANATLFILGVCLALGVIEYAQGNLKWPLATR